MTKRIRFFLVFVVLLILISGAVMWASHSNVPHTTPPPVIVNQSDPFLHQPWATLNAVLPQVSHMPTLGEPASKLLASLGDLETFCQKQFATAPMTSVTCIYNAHGQTGRGEMSDVAWTSQRLTAEGLQGLHPRLVGIEGCWLELFTLEQESALDFDFINGELRKSGRQPATRQEHAAVYESIVVRSSGARTYLRHNPVCRGIGIEDERLHTLHSLVIQLMTAMTNDHREVPPIISALSDALMDARTDMAMARVIDQAHKAGATEAVLPIGASHLDRMVRLRGYLKAPGDDLDAYSPR